MRLASTLPYHACDSTNCDTRFFFSHSPLWPRGHSKRPHLSCGDSCTTAYTNCACFLLTRPWIFKGVLLRQAVATSGPRPGTWQSLRLHWQFWALAMGSDSDSGPAVSESAGGCHHFILCMLARFSHLPGIAAHIHLNASHFYLFLPSSPTNILMALLSSAHE